MKVNSIEAHLLRPSAATCQGASFRVSSTMFLVGWPRPIGASPSCGVLWPTTSSLRPRRKFMHAAHAARCEVRCWGRFGVDSSLGGGSFRGRSPPLRPRPLWVGGGKGDEKERHVQLDATCTTEVAQPVVALRSQKAEDSQATLCNNIKNLGGAGGSRLNAAACQSQKGIGAPRRADANELSQTLDERARKGTPVLPSGRGGGEGRKRTKQEIVGQADARETLTKLLKEGPCETGAGTGGIKMSNPRGPQKTTPSRQQRRMRANVARR